MSNFRAMTRAIDASKYPHLKDWQPANWIDNHFGGRQYGIRFDSTPRFYRDNGDFVYSPDMEVPAQQGPNHAK